MVIQNLIGPTETECAEWGMFFRKVDDAGNDIVSYSNDDWEEDMLGTVSLEKESNFAKTESFPVRIERGEALSLESYFNAFSIGKWRKYTRLSNLSLEMRTQGKVVIRAFQAVGTVDRAHIDGAQNDAMLYDCIRASRREIDCETTRRESGEGEYLYTVRFPQLPEEGILYITAAPDAGEERASLISGAYCTDVLSGELNPVELVLGICTFQREEFLKRNVGKVLDGIIQNPDSPLYGHVEVYISDNGQSLPTDTFSDSRIHLYPNKNAGGAGGFTRTMIESLFYRKNSPFTHIILMDDDIVLSTDVLERTYHFLQLIDDEHKEMMVGGEMFTLSKRYRQYEAGATWKGTAVQFYNRMWDLRRQNCVAANEAENPINYSGWWYSVIPTSIITKDNLPIPLFIHYDDMEYGVRNEKNGTILLNGICVWHPQGVNKAASRMIYYDVRNMMIGMCDTKDRATAAEVALHVTNRVAGGVIRYCYNDAEICFEAMQDFYRGPEYFMELDPLKKHEELEKYNWVYEDPKKYGVDLSKTKNSRYSWGLKGLFLWGFFLWLLPSFRAMKVVGIFDFGIPFGARKVFHYDEIKGKGYMTEKSYRRAWKVFIEYWKVIRMISRDHQKMMDRWAEAKKQYTSLFHWEKYLGLKPGDERI